MTEPVDPTEAFAERMRLLSQQEFGGKFRPQYANSIATGTASTEDAVRIGAFVRALDVQKRVALQRMSGAVSETTGAENDLLNVVGAGNTAIRREEVRRQEEEDLPWYEDALNTVGKAFSQTGTAFMDSWAGDGLMTGLETIGKVPGFLYRRGRSLAEPFGELLGIDDPFGDDDERAAAMKAGGYTSGDYWDELAFDWNQGESAFNDLSGTREAYGNELVDRAVDIFRTGTDFEAGVAEYWNNDVLPRYQRGEITAAEVAKISDDLNSDEFRQVYEAVDRKHISPGRDFARLVLPESWEDDKQFSVISGTVDGLFTFFADPTIIGSKIYRGAQLARWGVDALNSTKINRILGVADETGAIPTKGVSQARREGVQRFVTDGAEYKAAVEAGEVDRATALYAGISQRHRDLMPLFNEVVMGKRLALSPADKAAAQKAGTTLTDINGVTHDAIQGASITTVEDFAKYAIDTMALMRLSKGMAASTTRIMPGRVGYWADKKAARMVARTEKGLAAHPANEAFNFARDADKIIPGEVDELLEKAAEARGKQMFDEAAGLEGRAKALRAKVGAANRRLSTMLVNNRGLRIDSGVDANKVRQFARTFLPKYEAERFAAMWEAGSPGTRRQLAKAMQLEVFEASGLTRSVIGRSYITRFMADQERLNARKYGLGESDRLPDVHGGERRVGLYPSQMEEVVALPSLTEMKRAAAMAAFLGNEMPALGNTALSASAIIKQAARKKLGTTGLRYMLFSSHSADRFMQLVKLGWITTGANAMRNIGDEYLLLTLTGQRKNIAQGKAIARAVTDEGVDDDALVRASKVAMMFHHLIPKPMRAKIVTADDAVTAVQVGKLQSMLHVGGVIDERRIAYARELNEETLGHEVDDYLGGRLVDSPDEMNGLDSEFARAAHERGVPLSRFELQGVKEVERDGGNGLVALVKMYSQRFLRPKGDWTESPANATLAFLLWHRAAESPEFLAALDEDTLKLMGELMPGVKFSASGKIFKDTLPKPEALGAYLKQDKFAAFRQKAELYNTNERGLPLSVDDAIGREQAIERMVPRYLEDVALAVTGKGGGVDPGLASRLLKGDIPDRAELSHMDPDILPGKVLKQQYGPVGTGAVNGIVDGATSLMTRAYDVVVTKPIKALVRMPLYVDAYTTARLESQKWADMLVNKYGWERAIADEQAIQIAKNQALQHVIRYVDNPAVASQFSAMSRNWWAFERAQEDWLRRYGRAITADPSIIQKVHLGIYGAEQAGILDRDGDGKLILTYPGSGAVMEALLHMGKALGFQDGDVAIPHVADLTTKMTFLNPSFQNPLGYSATPLVSLPWKAIEPLVPGGDLLHANIDLMMNGELGAGRSWYEQILPTAVMRLWQTRSGDPTDAGSVVGGAVATALLNLALTGNLDRYDDTEGDAEALISDVQTQALNTLYVRSVLGFVLPGAPSMPSLGEGGDDFAADMQYREQGIQDLNDEFRALVQKLGFGEALTLWAELHPEALVFKTGRTESATGAEYSTSLKAGAFVMKNKDLFTGDYGDVAAYFIPDAPGEFSSTTWNALNEMDIRQYKDTKDYFYDLVNVNSVSLYYDTKDDYEARIDAARLSGGRDEVKALQAEWDEKKKDIHRRYPSLQRYMNEYGTRSSNRTDRIVQLRRMTTDRELVDRIPQLEGAAQMLQVLDAFNERNDELKGERSAAASAARDELQLHYHDAMKQITDDFPGVRDLYNGVFRGLVSID